VEQKDMEDQGGAAKARERFTGGSIRTPERLHGSIRAVDPATGEIKAIVRFEYPNFSGALATAGNLVFLGHPDGEFTAYDARTLKEVWSFNLGTGIQAPPISYAVNGKQYIAVLAGSRDNMAILSVSPELKNMAPASMLYVFAL
jgi:alcohol dehydrogenase (cytochrome c)